MRIPDDTEPDAEERWSHITYAVGSAFGWSLEQVEDDMDLVRLRSLLSFWEEFPPLFLVPRMLAGRSGRSQAGSRQSSGMPRAGLAGWEAPSGNTLPDLALMGQVDGLRVQQVEPSYYKQLRSRLEAGTAAYLSRQRDGAASSLPSPVSPLF